MLNYFFDVFRKALLIYVYFDKKKTFIKKKIVLCMVKKKENDK